MPCRDTFFMQAALNEARNAFARGDVPVGALIVRGDEILSSGSDEKLSDPTEHAEIIAIRSCSRKINHWNLSGCTLYVTLEPCPMCAGACVNARISRVVYGAKNYKSGAGGTLYNILSDSRLNHTCKVESGIMEQECLKILQDYFLLSKKILSASTSTPTYALEKKSRVTSITFLPTCETANKNSHVTSPAREVAHVKRETRDATPTHEVENGQSQSGKSYGTSLTSSPVCEAANVGREAREVEDGKLFVAKVHGASQNLLNDAKLNPTCEAATLRSNTL